MSTANVHALSLDNLRRPEVRSDPYPFYDRLRSEDPVHWDAANGFWALTRHADIVAILHRPELSKAHGLRAARERLPADERAQAGPLYHLFQHQMLYADPPDHTRLRGLVKKAFSPRVVEPWRLQIQQCVDRLLDAVQAAGRMDVIGDFAFPLPAAVIVEWLGLPPEDRARFKQWSDDVAAGMGLVQRTPGVMARAAGSLAEFEAYLGPLRERLQRDPQDDLLSALVTVEEQGEKLNLAELLANTILLLAAGHETTTNLIGNGLLAMLRHPEQMEALQHDPGMISTAVEELLRYDNPVQIVWRVATEPFEIGGRAIERGQFLNLVVGAANRDPAQFTAPDTLDLTRRENRHLGFGYGIHFCLGAALGRLEGEIALTTLLRRMPGLRLAAEDLAWQENPIFRGLKALPVTF